MSATPRGLVLGLAVLALLTPTGAVASTYTVTTVLDGVDVTPGNDACATKLGACTLRAAVQEANAHAGADVITLPASVPPYTLTASGVGEDAAATGDLDVTGALVVNGGGAASTIVDGNLADRVFDVRASGGAVVTINGLTVQRGRSGEGFGGGLQANLNSILELNDVRVIGNELTLAGSSGGGVSVAVGATARLTRVTVRGNRAERGGGGIWSAGKLTLTDVTFSGNLLTNPALGAGGGLRTSGGATLTNVTLSGNSSGHYGGGIAEDSGSLMLLNVTVAQNSAPTGANLFVAGGGATLRNSVVANPTSGTNCVGAFSSAGNNLTSTPSCDPTPEPTDLQSADPLLGAFGYHGGFNEAYLLTTGSPAIDSGTNDGCPVTDQNAVSRPQGPTCDIGATEFPGGAPTSGAGGGTDEGSGSGVDTGGGSAGAPSGKTIVGTPGNDILKGTAGPDVIRGLGGNDRILGLGGADKMIGGPGDDRVFGGNLGDRLEGGPGNDRLYGEKGDDSLLGGPGRDLLFGGAGTDRGVGGPGRDVAKGVERARSI